MLSLWSLFVLASMLVGVDGSWGDRHYQFQDCFKDCLRECGTEHAKVLSWELNLLQWDCESNCKYECMTAHHQSRLLHDLEPVKYFGKWPFKRILGTQEIASVVFSIGNGLAHLHFFLNRHKVDKRYFARDTFILYAIVAMNTWMWSTAFHARETEKTERLDYYFALFHVFFSTAASVIRATRSKSFAQAIILTPFMILFVMHVRYMEYVQFDYGWNMKVNLCVGVLYILVWLTWAFFHWRPYSWKIVLQVILLPVVAALEVFDFPPVWGVFDAHACWHACTIPLVFAFYSFIFDDAAWEAEDRGAVEPKDKKE